MDGRELGAIFAGGAIGALLRAWLGTRFTVGAPGWPWTTFAINVSGSVALAYFATRLQERLAAVANASCTACHAQIAGHATGAKVGIDAAK